MVVISANTISEMNQKRIDSLFYPVTHDRKCTLRKIRHKLKKGQFGQIK